ncbi:unnamed protein product [Paramecium sonneborni]|uniref:Eukaryotic translation initiation factor 3 subunit I n=2 Tax=Paramecium sonneborni TaxID=65129 RepID=A0A8S1KNI7_9CILI|nr:unnamed protein product [Paramecium sonneborni]
MRPFHVRGTDRAIMTIKINYDGDLFFTASQDGGINCWLTENGERLGNYKASGAVKTLDLTDNSELLVSGSLEGSVDFFQINGGKSLGKLVADMRKAKWVEFSYGDEYLIIVYQPMTSSINYETRILKVQEILDKIKLRQSQDVLEITDTLVTPDKFKTTQASWGYLNQSIIMASTEGELLLLSYPQKQEIRRVQVHDGEIKQFTFAKDFSILATAANDGCKIFDPTTLQLLRQFKYEVPMNAVAISPLFNSDQKQKPHLIVAGGIPARETARTKFQGFDIHICNVIYEEEVGKLLNPNQIGPINALAFFPDGKGFITGEEGGYSRVYKFDQTYWENDLFK